LNRHSADDAIRTAFERNDPTGIERLWDRYASDLFAYLQAVLRSRHDAEDVLQAVFVRIVRKRHLVANARCLDAYVYQIARHEASGFLRRQRRRPRAEPDIEPWLVAADSNDSRTELAEELTAALSRLPRAQREVVVLKIYQEKTFQQIAEMLELSLNTVASRYRYALERLRAWLKDREP